MTDFVSSKHHRDKSVVWGNEQNQYCKQLANLIIAELEKVNNRPLTTKQLQKAICAHTKQVTFQVRAKKGFIDKALDITPERIEMALSWMKSKAWLGSERVQVKSRQGLIWEYARYLSSRYYESLNNNKPLSKTLVSQ